MAEEPKQPRRRRARVGAKRTVEVSTPRPSPPAAAAAARRRGRKRTPRQTEPEVVTTKHDENAAASLGLDVRFVRFVARYGKQTKYCPDGKYPCEEAFQSTKGVFEKLERDRDDEQKGWNEEASDAPADLENEEFARDHATYADAPVPVADQEAATPRAESAAIRRRRRGLPRLGDLSSRDLAALHAARPHSKRPRMSLNTHRSVDPSAFNTSSSSLGRLSTVSRFRIVRLARQNRHRTHL